MHRILSRREHQHMQMLVNQSKRLITDLLVVRAGVFNDQSRAPIECLGQIESQSALRFIPPAFLRIIR